MTMFERGYASVHLNKLDVTLQRLPKAFESYTIAHLSDLHLTPKTPLASLERLVNTLNTLSIDMIALTGDVYDAPASSIKAQLTILKQLKAPVYFVSGNHELIYLRHNMAHEIEQLGFHNLDNTCVLLEKEGACLQLVGLSDAYSGIFGLKRPLHALAKTINPTVCSLLLAHQPKDIHFATQHRIDLQLSGHTHGGQIYPFGYVVRLFQPYIKGLHKKESTQIYVNAGYGCWGINWRFFAKSEVAIITLKGQAHA